VSHILTFFLVAEAICSLVSLMFHIQNIKHLWSHGANFRLHYFVTNILRNIKQKTACESLPAWLLKFIACHILSYLLLCTCLINCISILATPKWQYLPHIFVCFLQITHIDDFEMCTTFTSLCRLCLSQYVDRPRQPDLPTSSSFYYSGEIVV